MQLYSGMSSLDSVLEQKVKCVCAKFGEGLSSNMILPPNQFGGTSRRFFFKDQIIYFIRKWFLISLKEIFSKLVLHNDGI